MGPANQPRAPLRETWKNQIQPRKGVINVKEKDSTMKRKIVIRTIACTAMIVALFQSWASAEVRGRIDIHPVGKKEIVLDIQKQAKNGWASHIGWGKVEERQFALTFNIAKVTAEWAPAEFTFIPGKSGKIHVFLLSNQREGEDRWVVYDQVRVSGATLANGGFETLSEDGKKATGWTSRGPGYDVLKDGKQSCEGTNCVKVFHDQPAIQVMEVTAGQPVSLSCMVKLPALEKKK
jgi:hypothetical protein